MTTILLLTMAVVTAVGLAQDPETDTLIVNGQMATYGDHPYICSLQVQSFFQYYHICGCVIYNQNTVITAASCLDGSSASYLRIQAGTHDMSQVDDYQVTRSITEFTMHPQYNGNAAGFPNNIAVMQLSSPLSFNSYISPANISSSSSSQVNQDCILSGWGRTSGGGSAAAILRKVTMTAISNNNCVGDSSFETTGLVMFLFLWKIQ